MNTLLKRELKAGFKSALIWAISTALLLAGSFWEYSVIGETGDYEAIFASMPQVANILFGLSALGMSDIIGYFALILYYIVFIGVAYAFVLGNSVVQKELDDKTSEFLFTKPITRKSILNNKMKSSAIFIIFYNVATAIVSIILITGIGDDVYSNGELTLILILTHLGLSILMLIVYQLTLAINIAFNKKVATAVAGASILYMYGMSIAIQVVDVLEGKDILTPWRYFTPEMIVTNDNSYNLLYVVISLLIIGLFKLVAVKGIECKTF